MNNLNTEYSDVIAIGQDDDGRTVLLTDEENYNPMKLAMDVLLTGETAYIGKCPVCESHLVSTRPGTRRCTITIDGKRCDGMIELEEFSKVMAVNDLPF